LYEFTLKPGRVTFFRLSQAYGVPKVVIAGGEMLRSEMAFTGTSGVVRFDHAAGQVLDACVGGIADPNAEMRALSVQNSGGQGFSTMEEMLAADVCDVVLIVSPNDTHAGIMQKLLATDKPILVEKPLATTSADCRDLLNMAKGRKAPVWVAMEYRYMPPLQRLMQALDQGAVGTPRMMSIREHRFPFLPKVDDWNRFNARTGGTLTEKCCHFWDLMRLVLKSDPVRVYASAGVDVNHRDERYMGQMPDIIDNAYVVVDFESGARGEHILAAGDHHGSTFFQHEKFLELVRTGKGAPDVSLMDGYWSVLVGEAAEESARSGQAIDLRGKGP